MERHINYNNHFGGEKQFHPLFDLRFLPETVASLFETAAFVMIDFLIAIFAINFFTNLLHIDNAASAMINDLSTKFFIGLGLTSNTITNMFALLIFVIIYVLLKRYFMVLKYNLHPRK